MFSSVAKGLVGSGVSTARTGVSAITSGRVATVATAAVHDVVLTRSVPQSVHDALEGAGLNVRRPWDREDEAIPRDLLLEHVAGVSGIYCLLTDRIDEQVLEAAGESLKVVSTMSVGFDHVDTKALASRGVALGNTPGVLTDATADLSVALILAAARRLSEGIDAVRDGSWGTWRPDWLCGFELRGATVGVVGAGRIGAAVAERMRSFGSNIVYAGRTPKPELDERFGARHVDLDTLLAESDVVTVHCALNDETRDMFDAAAFAKMKSSAIFVNTARGNHVVQDDLVDALTKGTIAAAGIDVTVPEPLPADHPLVGLPNCTILPHLGSAAVATRGKMYSMAAENLIAGVASKPLPYGVKL